MGILEDCLESGKLDRKFASESSLAAAREKGAITETSETSSPFYNKACAQTDQGW